MAGSGFRPGDRERARAKFRRLPASVRKNVEAALEQNAEELTQAIKRRAPVQKINGGELRDTVRWAKGAAKSKTRDQGADPDLTVRVTEGDAKKGFYAGMVEFGTVNSAPQPHFFPTWRAMKRRLKGRLSRAVNKAIKEAGS